MWVKPSASIRAPPKLTNRGVVHSIQEDYDHAIDDYTEAFRLDPGYAEALFRRGVVRRLNGDRASGDAGIVAAEKINPHLAEWGREVRGTEAIEPGRLV
jgi:tetratricopeptide (TPR) repeat protein